MMDKSNNFMRQFRDITGSQDVKNITASQLLIIWDHYDLDGNGFLEGDELDHFLREFVTSVTSVGSTEVISQTMFNELKTDFMDAYDDNEDGRIEIREVSGTWVVGEARCGVEVLCPTMRHRLVNMLPTDENFLLIFQLDNRITSGVDFMEIWHKYDEDRSGCIDGDELKNFLADLIHSSKPNMKVSDEKLDEYVETLLRLYDDNKDGKLQIGEMARLLPVKENVLKTTLSDHFFLEGSVSIPVEDIEDVFDCYDKDQSGTIEGVELRGLVRDLLEMMKPDGYSADEVDKFYDMMMSSCDMDGDGQISKSELTMMLLCLQRFQ